MSNNHDIVWESKDFQVITYILLTCADMTVPKYLRSMLMYLQYYFRDYANIIYKRQHTYTALVDEQSVHYTADNVYSSVA